MNVVRPEGGSELAPRLRRAAIAGWSAFLAASLSSIAAFGALDPARCFPGPGESRPLLVYSLGFLLLWTTAAIGIVLTTYLLRDGRR